MFWPDFSLSCRNSENWQEIRVAGPLYWQEIKRGWACTGPGNLQSVLHIDVGLFGRFKVPFIFNLVSLIANVRYIHYEEVR